MSKFVHLSSPIDASPFELVFGYHVQHAFGSVAYFGEFDLENSLGGLLDCKFDRPFARGYGSVIASSNHESVSFIRGE